MQTSIYTTYTQGQADGQTEIKTIRKTHRWARTWVFQNVVVVEVASVGEGLATTINGARDLRLRRS